MKKTMQAGAFTAGTDPEFVLRDHENSLASAIDYIKGTKEEPEQMDCGGNLQHDNVMVEFSTPVAVDKEDFVNKIRNAFMEVAVRLPKNHKLDAIASAEFPEKILEHPEAQRFGCDPDYDAWEITMNDPPVCDNPALRSCGGHFHTGFVKGSGNDFLLDPMGKILTVRAYDIFMGLPCVVLDNTPQSMERRKLYGKAGCHRPTDYGFEYRALSNFWFKSPKLVMLVYELAEDALALMRKGEKELEKLIDMIGKEQIINTINKNDGESAIKVVKEIETLFRKDTMDTYKNCLAEVNNFNLSKEWGL